MLPLEACLGCVSVCVYAFVPVCIPRQRHSPTGLPSTSGLKLPSSLSVKFLLPVFGEWSMCDVF